MQTGFDFWWYLPQRLVDAFLKFSKLYFKLADLRRDTRIINPADVNNFSAFTIQHDHLNRTGTDVYTKKAINHDHSPSLSDGACAILQSVVLDEKIHTLRAKPLAPADQPVILIGRYCRSQRHQACLETHACTPHREQD